MLLLSIIGLLIAGGMHFGTAVWARTEQGMADIDRINEAQTILREALSSAIPDREGGFVRFDGESDRIAFDGAALFALNGGGPARFEIAAEAGADGTRLVLRATDAHGVLHHAVLADHLGSLRVSYLDASERVGTWLAVWRDRGRLPDAIRIEQQGAAAAAWPIFVVHPAIAQDAGCQYDPVSTSCRN